MIGVGPWGGLAGGAVFGVVAIALGAPRSLESWAIWFALVGFTLGYGATSYVAYRIVRRSPRVAGGAVVLVAVLVAISVAADSSGWDWLYLFVPGAVLAGLLVLVAQRRARIP